MVRKTWLVVSAYLVIILILASCGSRNENQNSLDVQAIEATARAVIQQTANALPTTTPSPTITQTITPVYPPTDIPPATDTPTATITPTRTIQPTSTAAARVIMGGDTNCRSGPSNHYDWLGYIFNGESANIVGKAANLDYWVIENPDAEGTCWIWGGYATVEGDTSQIPNERIPPTKTPTKTATPTRTPSARFNLDEVIMCNGQETIVIRVYNSGRVDLRSFRILLFGQPGKVELSRFSSNQFSRDDQECDLTISVLEPYKFGYAMAPFDPTGFTEFEVDVQACTEAGSRGGCVNDYFGFNFYLLTATPTYTPTFTRTPTPTSTSTSTPTTPTP